LTEFHKILVIQTAFAGDVVLSLPLAQACKGAYPDVEIHYLVTPETAVLLKNHPCIDRILTIDKRGSEADPVSLFQWMRKLRKEAYDLALVPHRSIRSALLVRFAGIPIRIGFDKSAGAFMFTDVVHYTQDIHEIERNLLLIEQIGWQGKVTAPELYPGPDEENAINSFLIEKSIDDKQPLLAMAPGSLWATKRWLPEKFAHVAQKLWTKWSIPTILIGGKKDVSLSIEISNKAGEGVYNAVGRFSLLASAEMIRRCQAILTNDSAPLHLSVAVNTAVVAIFGPTIPEFGFAPFGNGHMVIRADIECSPCAIHGSKKCPKGHFLCMHSISEQTIIKILERAFDL